MFFIRKIRYVFVVMLFALSIVTGMTFAQNDENGNRGGSGLQVSPTRNELTIIPGASGEAVILVKNVTQGAVNVVAELNDFQADNTSGQPKLILDSEELSKYSLRNLTAGLDNFELDPGDTKEVVLKVEIPDNYPAGAYFGAVRFTAQPITQANSGGATFSLNASVASLLLVEVPGDIVEQIQVNSLFAEYNGSQKTFFTNSPDTISIEIANLGGGFAKPFGNVTLSMGGKELASYEINNTNPRSNILPESERIFKSKIDELTRPGKYRLTANMAQGSGGEVITTSTDFWYIPTWLISLAVGVVILLATGSYVVYRRKFAKKKR